MKNIAKTIWFLLMKGLLWNILPALDTYTDIKSGQKYYLDGHHWWAYSIWVFVGVPFVLAFVDTMRNLCLKQDDESPSESTKTWYQKHEMKILKLAAQIPFIQQVVHLIFTIKLFKAEEGIKEARAIYKNIARDKLGDQTEKIKDSVVAAAKDYVRWRREQSRILTAFQGIRLFELLGESGPQAVLQLSIALRIGYTDWIQERV